MPISKLMNPVLIDRPLNNFPQDHLCLHCLNLSLASIKLEWELMSWESSLIQVVTLLLIMFALFLHWKCRDWCWSCPSVHCWCCLLR